MDAAGLTAGVHTTQSSGELGGGGPANANTMYNTGAGYVATNTGPSIVEMSEWDETKVASWVSTLPRLKPYAQCFIDHQIEGKLFVRLEESMLREMGAGPARSARDARPGTPVRGLDNYSTCAGICI